VKPGFPYKKKTGGDEENNGGSVSTLQRGNLRNRVTIEMKQGFISCKSKRCYLKSDRGDCL